MRDASYPKLKNYKEMLRKYYAAILPGLFSGNTALTGCVFRDLGSDLIRKYG